MNPARLIESRSVLIADLDPKKLEVSIRAAISYFIDMYGSPKRVWVNAKDVPEDLTQIDEWKIEKRHGCIRGKVMVM